MAHAAPPRPALLCVQVPLAVCIYPGVGERARRVGQPWVFELQVHVHGTFPECGDVDLVAQLSRQALEEGAVRG